MDILIWLQMWYEKQCDGEWEHLYGVKIDTLDNPGWNVSIDLQDTVLENKKFDTKQVFKTEEDWIHCSIKNGTFNGGGDPAKLSEILMTFKEWVEEKQ